MSNVDDKIAGVAKKCFVNFDSPDTLPAILPPQPVPPLALVSSDSPILRTPCREVRQDEMGELKDPRFLYRLDKFRRQLKGVGLAAPQVGDSRQYFVWAPRAAKEKGELVINPEVTVRIGQTQDLEEGCLSFPGRRQFVERSIEIGVEYLNDGGQHRVRRLYYLEARIFLHEFDHLQGVCIV